MKINIFKHMHRYSEQCVDAEDRFMYRIVSQLCVLTVKRHIFTSESQTSMNL